MTRMDPGRALYPFLNDDADDDATLAAVLEDARQSALQKCADIVALRRTLHEQIADPLQAAADAVARSFAAGGKLLAFGNGGSATDAQDAAADCMRPALAHWKALPALALGDDAAVLTAVANDVGYDAVFARQVIAYGAPGDIALGISTSGNSPNVVAALVEARRRGMLTIGFAGCDGGELARSAAVQHCFVARVEYIPRIQEAQATVWHALLELVQWHLAEREETA